MKTHLLFSIIFLIFINLTFPYLRLPSPSCRRYSHKNVRPTKTKPYHPIKTKRKNNLNPNYPTKV